MKKANMLFALVLALLMSLQVGAQFTFEMNDLPSIDSDDVVTFIVEMEGRPVLPEIKFLQENNGDTKTENEKAYRSSLVSAHAAATKAINSELSSDTKPKFTYTEIFNGFAIEAKYGDLETIKSIEGVKDVHVSYKRKADLRMSNAPSMTHSLPTETFGYTGSGQVIAVLDSEFDVKHVGFSKMPQNPKYTKNDIADILAETEFNAFNAVNKVYESDKIPFRYDYAEGDADTYGTVNLHGTHVAGIAAGNSSEGDFCGVAPDAQLVLMKVVDAEGYFDDAAIAAALDDAAKLKVCAINCSFGVKYQATELHNPAVVACFNNAYNSGIFVSASSGNDGRGFYGLPTETVNIDDSATGNPNSLDSTFSVASVENSIARVNVSEITLHDGSVIVAAPMYESTAYLPATEYVYCGLGQASDFEDLDVSGKIAMVDRGVITFTEKSDNAKAAGAIGMMTLNSEDDYISSVELSLPAFCIKSSFGELLKDAEVKIISSISQFTTKLVENDMGISTFSSYGTTEALGLKPEITAPGGKIYSTLPNDMYGSMSGTSMAAPHITGVIAIISQYLEDMGCTATLSERVALIGNLIMSTADVIYMKSDDGESNVPFSPRAQGAGLVNTANAIRTPVILYGDSGKTKLELGDNLTDTLDITFVAQNLTENDVVYDKISAVTLTDGYVTEEGKNYISDARLLESELITDFDTVTVPANSSVRISAKIKLDIDELNENYLIFKNGFHIDGFIRLESTTSDVVPVGMPFMGFFGNWTQAPIFDTTVYDEGGSKLVYEPDPALRGTFLFTNHGESTVYLGFNKTTNKFDSDIIAISPNGDGIADVFGVQLTPMRSVRNFNLIVRDENGNINSTMDIGTISKFSPIGGAFNVADSDPDGQYYLTLEGYMNYNTENSIKHSVVIPFKLDREKPLIKKCKVDGNILLIDVYDFSGICYANITNTVTGEVFEINYESYVTDDEIVYNFGDNEIPDLSKLKVEIMDNAMNTRTCYLGGYDGKIGVNISEFSADEESYEMTVEFTVDEEFSDASLVFAFYDEKGCISHMDVIHNQSISSDEYVLGADVDVSTADKCKIFIWNDFESLEPLDTVNVFDLSAFKSEPTT